MNNITEFFSNFLLSDWLSYRAQRAGNTLKLCYVKIKVAQLNCSFFEISKEVRIVYVVNQLKAENHFISLSHFIVVLICDIMFDMTLYCINGPFLMTNDQCPFVDIKQGFNC